MPGDPRDRAALEAAFQAIEGLWDVYQTRAQLRALVNLQRAIQAMYRPWGLGAPPRLDER